MRKSAQSGQLPHISVRASLYNRVTFSTLVSTMPPPRFLQCCVFAPPAAMGTGYCSIGTLLFRYKTRRKLIPAALIWFEATLIFNIPPRFPANFFAVGRTIKIDYTFCSILPRECAWAKGPLCAVIPHGLVPPLWNINLVQVILQIIIIQGIILNFCSEKGCWKSCLLGIRKTPTFQQAFP